MYTPFSSSCEIGRGKEVVCECVKGTRADCACEELSPSISSSSLSTADRDSSRRYLENTHTMRAMYMHIHVVTHTAVSRASYSGTGGSPRLINCNTQSEIQPIGVHIHCITYSELKPQCQTIKTQRSYMYIYTIHSQ